MRNFQLLSLISYHTEKYLTITSIPSHTEHRTSKSHQTRNSIEWWGVLSCWLSWLYAWHSPSGPRAARLLRERRASGNASASLASGARPVRRPASSTTRLRSARITFRTPTNRWRPVCRCTRRATRGNTSEWRCCNSGSRARNDAMNDRVSG